MTRDSRRQVNTAAKRRSSRQIRGGFSAPSWSICDRGENGAPAGCAVGGYEGNEGKRALAVAACCSPRVCVFESDHFRAITASVRADLASFCRKRLVMAFLGLVVIVAIAECIYTEKTSPAEPPCGRLQTTT